MSYVPTGKQVKIPWAMKSIDKYREGFDRIFAAQAKTFDTIECTGCQEPHLFKGGDPAKSICDGCQRMLDLMTCNMKGL